MQFQECSVNGVTSWKQYAFVNLQHVKPIGQLRMPAEMLITLLTPVSRLHDSIKNLCGFHKILISWHILRNQKMIS